MPINVGDRYEVELLNNQGTAILEVVAATSKVISCRVEGETVLDPDAPRIFAVKFFKSWLDSGQRIKKIEGGSYAHNAA